MTGRRTDQQGPPRAELARVTAEWAPQHGDLVHDSAAGRAGVVVALPEDTGTNVYHLCPEGGGDEWPALRVHLAPEEEETGDGLTIDEAAMPPGGFAPDPGRAS